MATTYTEEAKFPKSGDGGGNWGAIFNGIIEDLDAGRQVTLTAGEALKKHDVVCMSISDGKMYKADSDDLTLLPPIGFVLEDVSASAQGLIRGFGWIDYEASWAVAASTSFSQGDIIYVGTTAGRITTTRPKNANILAKVKEDTDASFITKMFIQPLEDQHRQTQMIIIDVEDLAADADITNRPVFASPTAVELISIGILSQGTPAGIDDSNTCVILLEDDASNAIVTKTYNTGTAFPTSDYEDLGALDATHKLLTAGEHVMLSVTNGTNANPPAFQIIFEYMVRY